MLTLLVLVNFSVTKFHNEPSRFIPKYDVLYLLKWKFRQAFTFLRKEIMEFLPWSHTKLGKKICPNWVQFCVDPKWIMSSFTSCIFSLKIGEISTVKKTLNKSHLSGPRILDLFWFFLKGGLAHYIWKNRWKNDPSF